jgi:DNA-binding MarR family transcriptional regulator
MDAEGLFLQFIRVYHEVLRQADETAVKQSGLPDVTINQFFYLQEIGREGTTTLTALAERLGVTKPSATAAVTRLVRDGFILRERSEEDQRIYYLTLSKTGKGIINLKQETYRNFMRMIASRVTPEELGIVTEAFRLIVGCFPEYDGEMR